MRDADKQNLHTLLGVARALYPDLTFGNQVAFCMVALQGKANPAIVREWLDDDCPLPYRCTICMHYYDECDCSLTGRR